MTQVNYLEVLDYALSSIIKDFENRKSLRDITDEDKIEHEKIISLSKFNLHPTHVPLVWDKLERDGYITQIKDRNGVGETLRIPTIEGVIFSLKEGYRASHQSAVRNAKIAALHDVILSFGSVGAAIGTIGLLFWEIYKHYHSFHCGCH